MRHAARPAAITTVLAPVGVAAALLFTGMASAQARTPATITVDYAIPLPSGPPNVVTGSGTFSTTGSISDAGDADVTAHYTAVPSPAVAVLHTNLTLHGAGGTLELRCEQHANDFTDPAQIPDTGTCAILAGNGVYAGLHGSGTVTGTADLTGATPTVSETITL